LFPKSTSYLIIFIKRCVVNSKLQQTGIKKTVSLSPSQAEKKGTGEKTLLNYGARPSQETTYNNPALQTLPHAVGSHGAHRGTERKRRG